MTFAPTLIAPCPVHGRQRFAWEIMGQWYLCPFWAGGPDDTEEVCGSCIFKEDLVRCPDGGPVRSFLHVIEGIRTSMRRHTKDSA